MAKRHNLAFDAVLAGMQKYIRPLDMNGLQGRMLRIPARHTYNASHQILLVYGHHASIERMFGIADVLSDYGSVTMPDLPGFGGMDPFQKIGIRPSIDAMADYLAAFIKLKYRSTQVTLVGMSLGFVIITRMLQRYPELTTRVKLLVSLVGFSHKYDFILSPRRMMLYRVGARIFSYKLSAAFFYNVFLHPTVIRTMYGKTHNAKKKLAHLSEDERKAAIEYEVHLWRCNDVKTYMRMTVEFLNLDNCKKQINLPVHHVTVDNDQYFDHQTVEQHFRIIFTGYTEHTAVMPTHAPSILASKEDALPFVPASVKKVLRQLA